MKKVLLSEDVSDDVIQSYIDKGFKPYFLSKRKIRKKDKKVWNKIQRHHLDPAVHVVFNQQGDWDEINISGDPILDKLLTLGVHKKLRVLKSIPVNSMEEAITAQDMVKDIDIKFAKVVVKYRYVLRDDVPPAKTGSRPFCQRMMASGKLWTLSEIRGLDNGMKGDIGDVFLYRGGFYHNPDTDETSPFCRHQWEAVVVVE